MANQIKLGALFRYLFLSSLLGYSAFLATEGRIEASGAVLGGCIGLYSLQNSDDESNPEQEDALEALRLQLMEVQHEVEYYKYKLVESDLRNQYQGVVNQNMIEINQLKQENRGFATTVTQEQHDNSSKAQKISCLESENVRLREQIAKMEKDRILKMKRSVLKGVDGGKALEMQGLDPDANVVTAES